MQHCEIPYMTKQILMNNTVLVTQTNHENDFKQKCALKINHKND